MGRSWAARPGPACWLHHGFTQTQQANNRAAARPAAAAAAV